VVLRCCAVPLAKCHFQVFPLGCLYSTVYGVPHNSVLFVVDTRPSTIWVVLVYRFFLLSSMSGLDSVMWIAWMLVVGCLFALRCMPGCLFVFGAFFCTHVNLWRLLSSLFVTYILGCMLDCHIHVLCTRSWCLTCNILGKLCIHCLGVIFEAPSCAYVA
jgi:hypothetical protein